MQRYVYDARALPLFGVLACGLDTYGSAYSNTSNDGGSGSEAAGSPTSGSASPSSSSLSTSTTDATSATQDLTTGPTGGDSSSEASTGGLSPMCSEAIDEPNLGWPFSNPFYEYTEDLEVGADGSLTSVYYVWDGCGADDSETVLDFGEPWIVGDDGVNTSMLAQYTLDGGLEMQHLFKGPGNIQVNDVEVAEDGKIYVLGIFKASVQIPMKLGDPNNSAGWTNDADTSVWKGFLAIFDGGGNRVQHVPLWSDGGESNIIPYALDVSPNGAIAVAGTYVGDLDFDAGDCATFTPTMSQDAAMFLAVYADEMLSAPLVRCSAQVEGKPSGVRALTLSFVDGLGVVVGGDYYGDVAFGPVEDPGTHESAVVGPRDAFLAGWDIEGNHPWHLVCGSPTNDAIRSIRPGASGALVVAGSIGDKTGCSMGSVDQDSVAERGFVGSVIPPKGGRSPQWIFDKALARDDGLMAQPTHSEFLDARTDECGQVVVIGYANGVVAWDGGEAPFVVEPAPADPPGVFDKDVVIAKLAPDGQVLWSRRIRAPGEDMGTTVGLSPGGDIYAGGFWGATAPTHVTPGIVWPAATGCMGLERDAFWLRMAH